MSPWNLAKHFLINIFYQDQTFMFIKDIISNENKQLIHRYIGQLLQVLFPIDVNLLLISINIIQYIFL